MIHANQDDSAIRNPSGLSGSVKGFIPYVTRSTWVISKVTKRTLFLVATVGLKLMDASLYGKLLVPLTEVGTPEGSMYFFHALARMLNTTFTYR